MPVITRTSISENNLKTINKKLDKILYLVGKFSTNFKILGAEFLAPSSGEPGLSYIPDMKFPMRDLSDVEKLELYVSTEEGNNNFIRHLNTIGGNDGKNMIHRILKQHFSNALADLCSWTGRKGNYEVGKLKQFDIMFTAVHQTFGCTRKNFELVVMEWLRHAKQRLLREGKKECAFPI